MDFSDLRRLLCPQNNFPESDYTGHAQLCAIMFQFNFACNAIFEWYTLFSSLQKEQRYVLFEYYVHTAATCLYCSK